MKTVYKYPITGKPISLPYEYKILTVGFSDESVCVWIELESDVGCTEKLYIDYIGTGWEVTGTGIYVGTVIAPDGFVWHVYKEE